jgi:hypothetical protein
VTASPMRIVPVDFHYRKVGNPLRTLQVGKTTWWDRGSSCDKPK